MTTRTPTTRTPTAVRIWVALLTVYVVWGSTYLAIRYAIGHETGETGLPPLAMAALRFTVVGVGLFAWAVRRPASDGRPDPLGWPQWRATAIVGVALLLGGNGLVVLAEQRVDSYIAAILVALLPIWTALLALVLGGERPTRAGVVGLVLGFVGVVVLVNPFGRSSVDVLGTVMVLAASLSWAAGSYYSRTAPMPSRPLVMTAMEMMAGGLALALIGVATGDWADLDVGVVGPKAWLGLAYLAVFGSLAAFTAYVWLLRHAQLSLITTYAYVNPIVAVVLGALFVGERITPRTLLASAVIVVGVALLVTARRTPDTAAEAEPTPEPGPAVAVEVRPAEA